MSIHTAQELNRESIHHPMLEQRTYQAIQDYAHPTNPSPAQTLDQLFPEQKRKDKRLKEAKSSLGLLAFEFNESQLQEVLSEVEFLVESWLDEYERQTFGGLTLRELLHEKGAR